MTHSIQPFPKRGQAAVTVLFLASNPRDQNVLGLDEEFRKIKSHIGGSKYRDAIRMECQWAARVDDLQQELLVHKPSVLHFSGHGSDDPEGLVFSSAESTSALFDADALDATFRVLKDNIRVVVLNACYSTLQAHGIATHVDCVIGMRKAIGDESAVAFAASFYRALAFGRSVQDAFDLGIATLKAIKSSDHGVPDLLCRRGIAANTVFIVGEGADLDSRTVEPKNLANSPQGDAPDVKDLDDIGGARSEGLEPGDDGSGGLAIAAPATHEFELTLDRDFDSYSPQEQAKLLQALGSLLGLGKAVKIRSKRRGSVRLVLDLTDEQAEIIRSEIALGTLAQFGVTTLRRSKSLPNDVFLGNDADATFPVVADAKAVARHFEDIYREAAGDSTRVPWADDVPSPALVAWLNNEAPSVIRPGASVSVVACGLGDNVAELAGRGYDVLGFDVSRTAIRWAQRRHPSDAQRFLVADLFQLPSGLMRRADLVVVCNVFESVHPEVCQRAANAIVSLARPHGIVLTICRAGESPTRSTKPPFLLAVAEVVSLFANEGWHPTRALDEFMDAEIPNVRWMRGTFRRR